VSDYFTRLAERALGASPLPRPALPSQFEPASHTGFEEIELEAPPIGMTTRQAQADSTLGAERAAGIDRSQSVSDQYSTTPEQHAVEPAPSAPEPMLLSPQRAAEDSAPAPVEQILTHEHHREIIERQSIVIAPPPAATPRERPVVPDPQPRRIEARPLKESTEATNLSVARDLGHDAPAPTVVQVTIGRVDVRAVTTPTPSRERSQPRRPVRPSLEDYLSGGGGRP
jgi:hypothetical protein